MDLESHVSEIEIICHVVAVSMRRLQRSSYLLTICMMFVFYCPMWFRPGTLDWLGGRPLHWFVCQICTLTSWATRVFWKLDGGTTGTQSFTGPLDRTASGLVYRLLVAQFDPVAGHLTELLEAAADQLLLHRFTITVNTGSLFKWRGCLGCISLLRHQSTSSFRSSDIWSASTVLCGSTHEATIAASTALGRSCTAWSCSRFSAEHAEAVIVISVA